MPNKTHLLSLFTLCLCSHVWLDAFGTSYEWFVPLTWTKAGGAEQQSWLLGKEGRIFFPPDVCSEKGKDDEHSTKVNFFLFCIRTGTGSEIGLGANDWLVANINMKGFYRVNYDSNNWERLLNKLITNHQVQHFPLEIMLRYNG